MPTIEINWSKLIPLNKENIEKLPNTGGVYRFSKKEKDGHYYVFFVGSSEDLKERLLSCISDKETNTGLRGYLSLGGDFSFRYALVNDKKQQEAIERQMYKHYAPEYNLVEPQCSLDVEANLI